MPTPLPNTPHLRPFWVAIAFVNFKAVMPMIEVDLRRVDAASAHHSEAIACRLLLEEVGRTDAYIICAQGKAADADDLHGDASPPDMPPLPSPAPIAPLPPATLQAKLPSPRQRAEAIAAAHSEVAANVKQLLASVPRGNVQLTAPTHQKLLKALEDANFAPTEGELANVASTLLGQMVSTAQPLYEADGRAILAFLETVPPERLDLLFPVLPMVGAG